MDQDAHQLSHALCGSFWFILHHNFRPMSQLPNNNKNVEVAPIGIALVNARKFKPQ